MMRLNILLGFFVLLMNCTVLSADNSIKMIRDQSYGDSPLQTMDIYLPADAHNAPILFLIHGGAWQFGDKRATGLIKNKIARWLKHGFIIVSANYRLVPEIDPITQTNDIALALKTVQQQASSWGGDADKVILLGHSAGAHLLALLTSNQTFSQQHSLRPWLGSLIIDSQALDLVSLMQQEHVEFYDKAFGRKSTYWQQASPISFIDGNEVPMLVVCSLQRHYSCENSANFVEKAKHKGVRAELIKQDMTHNQTLEEIGLDNAYTRHIEKFMSDLDPVIAAHLSQLNK